MWNVLSSSCEHFKRALLLDGPTVAKGNGVGFKIFLGFNSAFPSIREQRALHGWDTQLFMKTGMWNSDVEMQFLEGWKKNGIPASFIKPSGGLLDQQNGHYLYSGKSSGVSRGNRFYQDSHFFLFPISVQNHIFFFFLNLSWHKIFFPLKIRSWECE